MPSRAHERQSPVPGAERILDDRVEDLTVPSGLLPQPAVGGPVERVCGPGIEAIGDRRGGEHEAAELGVAEKRPGMTRSLLRFELGGMAGGGTAAEPTYGAGSKTSGCSSR